MQKVKKYLQEPGTDVNAANVSGDAPLHCYVKSDRADKLDLIYTLLVHCNYKVLQIDKPNFEGKPPLHVAIEVINFLRQCKLSAHCSLSVWNTL